MNAPRPQRPEREKYRQDKDGRFWPITKAEADAIQKAGGLVWSLIPDERKRGKRK